LFFLFDSFRYLFAIRQVDRFDVRPAFAVSIAKTDEKQLIVEKTRHVVPENPFFAASQRLRLARRHFRIYAALDEPTIGLRECFEQCHFGFRILIILDPRKRDDELDRPVVGTLSEIQARTKVPILPGSIPVSVDSAGLPDQVF